MYTPEDRKKHAGRVRTTPNTFALYQMAARSGRRAVTGSAPALGCMSAPTKRLAHAGSSPSARATGCDYVISELNPWSSEERHFIFNHLKWCFTRYTALSAEFVFNLSKLIPKTVIINLGHIFFFFKMVTYVQNKLITATIIVDISILGFNAHCMRPTR